MSDGTHLSHFAGEKKEWPVYMTIGNLSSKIYQMLSTHSIVMGACLLIPIKNRNIPQKWLDEQPQTTQEVMNKVLRRVLQHLTSKQNPCAKSGYYKVLCAEGNFRHCKPLWQHGMQIAQSIATDIIWSGMLVFDANVQRMNLEIMSLLTSNTTSGITTYIERSAMPTPRQPMANTRPIMFTEDSTCFDLFLVW